MKRYKIFLNLLALLCCLAIQAQNLPDTSNHGYPSGKALKTPITITNLPSGLKINYKRIYSPVLPVKTDIDLNGIKDDCAKSAMQTICTDGLGRTIQTVTRKPFNISTKKDLVQHHIYDTFGREKRILLPFAKAETDPAKNGKFNPAIWTNLRSTYTTLGYASEQFLYSEYDLENSPLSRVKKIKNEGNNWVGRDTGKVVGSGLNKTGNLVKWTIGFTASLPAVSGTYSIGSVKIDTIIDEENNMTLTYTDMDGKMILQDDKGIQQIYVYDDLNRLRFEIPQKAITAIASNGQVVSQQIADNLCTRYEYDEDGRLIILKKPGIDETHYVYDKYDQIIFTQDPLKRTQGKWVFNKYDPSGRLIQTGLMNNEFLSEPDPNNPSAVPSSVIYTRELLQSLVDYSSLSDSLLQYIFNSKVYRHYEYIDVFGNGTAYVDYYFDSYDFTNVTFSGGTNFGAYDAVQSKKVKGLLTGTRALLSDNSRAVWTYNFYNSRSELIEVKRINYDGSMSSTDMGYDFKGRMISSEQHNGSYTIAKKYQYDVLDRVMFVSHRINSAASFTKIAQYNYDDIGRVSQKILGNMSYPVNYEYNIRNWITGINKAYCDDKTQGFYFGMTIHYDQDYNKTYLDGKTAGIRWRNKGTADELRSYGYIYDKGRMTLADYVQKDQGVSNPYNWSKTVKDFTTGVSYDLNGNITAMNHKGINDSKQIIDLDILAYTYDNNSNVLNKVVENSISMEAKDPGQHNGFGDFRDNINTPSAPQDYTYDANGNLTHDENRDAYIIVNDWFTINKPTHIEKSNADYIDYVYDALGNLLTKTVLQHGTPGTTTNYAYIGDIVYKNGSAQMIMHDEGRVRIETGSTGTNYAYDYFLKDHIDNVRTIITEDAGASTSTVYPGGEGGYTVDPDPNGTPTDPGGAQPAKLPITYLATSEPANSEFENSVFENIETTRDLRPLSTDPANKYCAKITGTDDLQGMGPSIILKVSADDAIQIGVETFFYSDGIPGDALPLKTLATGLVGLLTGGAMINSDGIALTQQGIPVSVSGTSSALTQIRAGQEDTTKPKAYLNYMMFDDRMQFVPEASGAVQVSVSNTWKNINLPKLAIPTNGYLYVFTSNQTPATVRVDNLYVISYTSRLLEENHYYPYGLSFDTYKAPGNKSNDVKYNSQYIEQNEYVDPGGNTFGLDWYDFAARSYDPQLGRWLQPDPMMQHTSPYLAMNDNPVSFTDQLGLWDGRNPLNGEIRTAENGDKFGFNLYGNGQWSPIDIENYAGWSGNGLIQRGSPSPDLGKTNMTNYNDPLNGQSHKSFDANTVWSKGSINNKINSKGFDIDKAVKHLNTNAHKSWKDSKGECAKYVRLALEAGGINTSNHPVPAGLYGSYLQRWGFNKVSVTNYNPVMGDIVVIQGYPGGTADPKTGIPYGHIEMYNGNQWVSDFKQSGTNSGFWPGPGYREHKPSFQIYRWDINP